MTSARVGIPQLVFSPANAVEPNRPLANTGLIVHHYDPARTHVAAQAIHADYICLTVSMDPTEYPPCYTSHTKLPRCSCGGRDVRGNEMCANHFKGGEACAADLPSATECSPELPQNREAACNLAETGCCTPSFAMQQHVDLNKTVASMLSRSPTCPSLFYQLGQFNKKSLAPTVAFRVAATAYCLGSTNSCKQQSCSQRDFWFTEENIDVDPRENKKKDISTLIL